MFSFCVSYEIGEMQTKAFHVFAVAYNLRCQF